MNTQLLHRSVLIGALVAGACTHASAAATELTPAKPEDVASGTPLYVFIKYTEALQKGDKNEALKYGTERSVSMYFDKRKLFDGRRKSVNSKDTLSPFSLREIKKGDEVLIMEFEWTLKNSKKKDSSPINFIKVGGSWKVCEPFDTEGKK